MKTTSVSFREIDLNDIFDLREFAKLYAHVVARSTEGLAPTSEDYQRHLLWLKHNRDRLFCLLAEDEQGRAMGSYVLYFDEFSPTKTCFVKSSWVSHLIRSRDIQDQFDLRGEEWARDQGAHKVVSRVLAEDAGSIELNSLHGFRAVRLEMEKVLA